MPDCASLAADEVPSQCSLWPTRPRHSRRVSNHDSGSCRPRARRQRINSRNMQENGPLKAPHAVGPSQPLRGASVEQNTARCSKPRPAVRGGGGYQRSCCGKQRSAMWTGPFAHGFRANVGAHGSLAVSHCRPRARRRRAEARSKVPTIGSPPRAWGRLDIDRHTDSQRRFTPTCVGKT